MHSRYRVDNKWSRFVAAPVVMLLLAAGCAGRTPPAAAPVPVASAAGLMPVIADEIFREKGLASWYGSELHGKKTASNERFDAEGLSAAHRTLPFGTLLQVTNLDNQKSIEVRVNDRGPFMKDRILEVSLGAARKLGFVERGVARVALESLDAIPRSVEYTIQAAMYSGKEHAEALRHRLSRKYGSVTIVRRNTNLGDFYCVRIGTQGSPDRAEQIVNKLKLEGLEPLILKKD